MKSLARRGYYTHIEAMNVALSAGQFAHAEVWQLEDALDWLWDVERLAHGSNREAAEEAVPIEVLRYAQSAESAPRYRGSFIDHLADEVGCLCALCFEVERQPSREANALALEHEAMGLRFWRFICPTYQTETWIEDGGLCWSPPPICARCTRAIARMRVGPHTTEDPGLWAVAIAELVRSQRFRCRVQANAGRELRFDPRRPEEGDRLRHPAAEVP